MKINKTAPFYEVREIKDLKDMLNSSVKLYGDRVAILKKDKPGGEYRCITYNELKDDIFCEINIQDLELVEDGGCTDEELLERLPKKDPHWWCKVEDGLIMNLKGDKKNKIPYDYNS